MTCQYFWWRHLTNSDDWMIRHAELQSSINTEDLSISNFIFFSRKAHNDDMLAYQLLLSLNTEHVLWLIHVFNFIEFNVFALIFQERIASSIMRFYFNVKSNYSVWHQLAYMRACTYDIRYVYVRHTSYTFQIRWHTSVYIVLYAKSISA